MVLVLVPVRVNSSSTSHSNGNSTTTGSTSNSNDKSNANSASHSTGNSSRNSTRKVTFIATVLVVVKVVVIVIVIVVVLIEAVAFMVMFACLLARCAYSFSSLTACLLFSACLLVLLMGLLACLLACYLFACYHAPPPGTNAKKLPNQTEKNFRKNRHQRRGSTVLQCLGAAPPTLTWLASLSISLSRPLVTPIMRCPNAAEANAARKLGIGSRKGRKKLSLCGTPGIRTIRIIDLLSGP